MSFLKSKHNEDVRENLEGDKRSIIFKLDKMSATVRLSQLYSILIEKRGKEEADAIVNYVEEKVYDDVNHSSQTIYDKIDKSNSELNAKIDKCNAEIKEYVGRSLRQQLWAIIALFVPLYLALSGFFGQFLML